MSLIFISFFSGFFTAQLPSSFTLIIGTLAYTFTLIATLICLNTISVGLVIELIVSILAFNSGLIVSVLGNSLMPSHEGLSD